MGGFEGFIHKGVTPHHHSVHDVDEGLVLEIADGAIALDEVPERGIAFQDREAAKAISCLCRYFAVPEAKRVASSDRVVGISELRYASGGSVSGAKVL